MKNTFLFVLSGEHPTLPLAELEAVIGIYSDFYLLGKQSNLAIYHTSRSGRRFIQKLSERLAMTHSISEFLGACYLEDLEKFIKTFPKFEMPFRIRVHLNENRGRTEAMERDIGSKVSDFVEKSGRKPKIDLKNPKTSLEFFIKDGEVYCGMKISDVKGTFGKRKATRRPFFRPVSLDPKFARTMVNLTRKEKGRLLDPFCGTGGILIEAGLTGFKLYGFDKDEGMVEGTRENLREYGLEGKLAEGDARETEKLTGKNFFDCVVTAPPFGRLSSTKKTEINSLYQDSVKSIEKVLKPGGYLVIAKPVNINLNTKMKLIEIHRDRVNRSMERTVEVYKK